MGKYTAKIRFIPHTQKDIDARSRRNFYYIRDPKIHTSNIDKIIDRLIISQ